MEWFKCIDKFNENAENVWNYDGSVFIDLETWKSKEKLEQHLADVYKDASVGERKGLKQHVVRFVSEVDELLFQIGNKSFHTASKEYKDETIKTLEKFWIKACKVYFNNKDGKAVYSRLQRSKNKNKAQSINAIIPFGPWILWKKEDWEDVDYKYSKWLREQKRNKHNESDSSEESDSPISQSQKDRGRKKNKDHRSKKGHKSRSRSRSRNPTSSHNRKNHDHRNTSSNSNNNNDQSSDGANSDSTTV